MKPITYLYVLLLFFSPTILVRAQGCSDAGFCSIDDIKPGVTDTIANDHKHQFKLGVGYGLADYDIGAIGSYLEYKYKFNDAWAFNAKLTSLAQSGNDISVFGLSDLFLTGSYKTKSHTSFSFGAKIPLTDGNRILDGLPLPMDYQSSLGTVDLLLGVGQKIGKFQIVGAWQQPLTQNSNQFVAMDYPEGTPLRNFQTTRNFERAGDVLLRASFNTSLNEKFKITLSALGIYHLTEDKYSNAEGTQLIIAGSDGLTINGNIFLDYNFQENQALQLSLAAPFLVREARPDGLTRSFLINLEYLVRF